MDHASIPDDSLVVRSVGGSGSPDGAVAAALALARDILGLSTVIVAPADGPAPRVAYADDGGFGLGLGDSIPLPDALQGGGQTGPVVLMANGSADGVPLGAGTFVGMPLADGDGRAVGVLCALDRQPRPLPAEAIGRLRLLAPLIAHALGSEPSRSRDRVGQRRRDLLLPLESVADAFVAADAAGRIVAWNRAAEATFGYRADEAIGRNVVALLPDWEGLVRGADATGEAALGETRPAPPIERDWRRRDGGTVPLELTVGGWEEDGGRFVSVVARDLTERRRAEAAHLTDDRRLREALEQSPVVAWLNDEQGRIVFLNEAGARLHGRTSAEVIGKTNYDLMPVELARERQAEDDAVLRAGEPIEFTQRIPIPNHDSREWLSVKYPVVDAEGKRYAGGFAFDVTERAEAEAALRQAKEAAEAASRLKSQFLSTMSHELRTPLTAITGYAELLRMDGSLGPEHTADIEQITTSANHLLALVDDVLHLAQIEAGKTTIEPREVDLAAAVDRALAEVALRAAAKGLALDADVPAGPAVLADPLRLHQVLVNLVDNAVKFTDRGSVRVEARPVADGVEIAVADTGIGIAAEAAQHIFAAFQQADGSTSRRHGGAGLGLAIAKQLVDLHGGEIAVASRPGEGSTFTVRLPAAPATVGSGRAVAAMSA